MELSKIFIDIISSFAIVAIFMPFLIGYLVAHKEGQSIREEGPKWHEKKSGTPTMGGLLILLGMAVTNIWVGAWMHQMTHALMITTLVIVLFGCIGFIDDFIKVFKKRNLGLKALQKLILQIVVAIIFLYVYFNDNLPINFSIPGLFSIDSKVIFVLFTIFWLVGFSNATNLTDGIDGLLGGLGAISYFTYAIIALNQNRVDIAIVCFSVVGGLLAFLIFNHKPAKIFMGDVGSLALGAGLAAISILLGRYWSLLLIGLIYVIETASVMLQVFSFKVFHRRIFKMTPIHHHFEMLGWNEWKIDIVFWIFGIICSAIYLIIFI
ncbi:phospho-N-acetylmuramoyl-pentapeptide-transferase [Companilactobacillus sp.]|jgi:phospho-N-acetylmuramoyl-pentapeptide-transferase|uniref:phospho-N-acetylmuramoyl-pentapeptide- transferase n=1 Tax=Companilactobacillus sp. TaxID=2767905 RepID=UPI0025BB861B|nr:phospho-N-acetylmuramoyl-pentapeptide-transferase [Companilactobacillus sp.]MCH4008448.1 phospho-N-acetylmuramoyl-pentapeptide-transferase [Companilactobacillus sp.]MCH4051373.1 phospho-N-acetylmuramoyl-pentapeptide-transferase [Companilactobacillus sp.]MCH4076391.1 phospho-N-acetylmuramoyl-pentapeptide-transferase [Companilactobacillus sp.]MCH4124966.1 phospho-N-acetylmuramoyl-pentapeptide-transferase [Companilactobacillus sp.]MCH4131508.1 phospho-N-acetylmuramoyl-pentapeptide-transferase 